MCNDPGGLDDLVHAAGEAGDGDRLGFLVGVDVRLEDEPSPIRRPARIAAAGGDFAQACAVWMHDAHRPFRAGTRRADVARGRRKCNGRPVRRPCRFRFIFCRRARKLLLSGAVRIHDPEIAIARGRADEGDLAAVRRDGRGILVERGVRQIPEAGAVDANRIDLEVGPRDRRGSAPGGSRH